VPITVRPSGDPILDQFQREVSREFATIPNSPLDQAVVLEDVDVRNGVSTTFRHTLGRVHQGWIIVSKRGFCDVREVYPRTLGRLVLEANADATISVLVF
jgi:hypothetical protein